MNDWSTWRYSYDLNGNLHLLNPGNSARILPLRYDLRDRITRLGDVQYRLDEDGFLSQRGSDVFDYNSKGQLLRAYNRGPGGWSVVYHYDGLGRRVSTRNSLGQHLQFFYADLNHPARVTHIFNHSSSDIASLYYDLQVMFCPNTTFKCDYKIHSGIKLTCTGSAVDFKAVRLGQERSIL